MYMISRTFTKNQLNRLFYLKNQLVDIKKCKSNCKCENRLKILSQKNPINIIDEAFISFQIEESKKDYNKCYNNKN